MESGLIKIESKRDYLWLALYEFIGSTIFLLGINFSNGQGLIVGLSLFIACLITARIGGGHFNGGVTLAVYIIERKWKANLPIAVLVWIVDILGCYTGILIAAGLQ